MKPFSTRPHPGHMSPAAAPPPTPADHLDHGRFSWLLLVSPLAQNAFLMTTPPAQNLPHCYSLVPVSELICVCVSNSVTPTMLLCLWDSLGKNPGVGCYFLLQGIFQTQG